MFKLEETINIILTLFRSLMTSKQQQQQQIQNLKQPVITGVIGL